eukprot:PITA_08353
MFNEDWKKLDRKAKSTIRLCISDSVLLNISGEALTKNLWDKLGALYQSKSRFDEIITSFLSEEMRGKNMEGQNGDALSDKHFKKDYRSKSPEKGKGFDDAPSAEAKTTSDEGGDVYLASSSSTQVYHKTWLIDSNEYFHFTPHREWLCEYDKYDGGDVFVGDDKKARIVGRRKVKLKLQGGRIRTLSGVLIPALARNLIYVSKLDDAGVKTLFDKDTYKMVLGH